VSVNRQRLDKGTPAADRPRVQAIGVKPGTGPLRHAGERFSWANLTLLPKPRTLVVVDAVFASKLTSNTAVLAVYSPI